MNKRHLNNDIIERKLEQLPSADADHLWNDMHAILDEKMPQKKERRRFIVWWFLSGKGLLFLSFGVLIITGAALYYLSKKENSAVAIKELPVSPEPDKFIENGTAKVSKENKEIIGAVNESSQKTGNNISATKLSTSAVDHVNNYTFTAAQTTKSSNEYTTKQQFNQPTQAFEKNKEKTQFVQPLPAISNARTNFDMVPVNSRSIYQDFLAATNPNELKDSLSRRTDPIANKVNMNTNNKNESGFYTGIVSGVDLSSIDFQSAKTGNTIGLIIGYAFNNKWSIESGLLWDTKRVYDNGSHFNPPGYAPTNGITIVAVNGKSRLYELPVNMKYTIISGRHSLFATSGLSSYLMRSENYDYEYTQNSQPGGHNYLSYKNKTKNWFSVVNLSVGYTHKLGGSGSIRVEPYLKLPIKNLGVGNMPIMSTGINIGFTKPIRR